MAIKLAPSILSADFANLAQSIKLVEDAGVEWLHIDVMDGHFVPNITIGPLIVKAIRNKSNLFFDVHLMIENPDTYIPEFIKAGADLITVHAESCKHLHRTIQNIKSFGVKAGVAINPATSLNSIEDILPELDLVLLMSVNPGFGGQSFLELVIPKLEKLREMIEGKDIEIQVDGGININTAPRVITAGASCLVAGSAIFGSDDPAQAVMDLRKAVSH